MIERARRVVLLIDYDNLQICASRDTPGRELQLPPVVQLAQRYGTVILARAYAEWNLSTERLAVYKAGIEPAFAPVLRTESDRSGKSLADTVMVAEGMDMLWTLSPEVVVLATSDKDLIPLVRVAKQRGAFVVVLGSDFTAIPLREMADEHVTYRQLITDASGRLTEPPGASRQPAVLGEPTRRRTQRTGRERVGAPTPTPTIAPAQPAVQAQRPDREASLPVTAAPALPSAAIPSAEPVAPVLGGLSGDADAPAGGRRRRRRGSRRRSERLGAPGEGVSFAENNSSSAEGFASDALLSDHSLNASSDDRGDDDDAQPEFTPTTSAADVAQASSGTIEEPTFDPSFEPPFQPSFDSPREPSFDSRLEPPFDPSSEPSFEPSFEAPGTTDFADVVAPPVVRDRRRRTRRPVERADVSSTGETGSSSPPDALASVDDVPASPTEPLADMLAGGEVSASENGTQTADESPRTPATPRPRRVASASRGRRIR